MEIPRKQTLLAVCAACCIGHSSADAQLVVTFLGDVPVPSSVLDQFGQSFEVEGMSGVCALGGDSFAAVMDNSNRVVLFDLPISGDGTIGMLTNVHGLTLSFSGDHEAIVHSAFDRLLIADENTMTLCEVDLSTGDLLSTSTVPPVFDARRPNLGLESLSLDADSLWTANEEALTVDGPVTSPVSGSVARLLSQSLATGTENGQWAYLIEPMHGPTIPPEGLGQSGLTELVALPGGGLLAIERSLALASPIFLTRMYSVDVQGATEVSGYASLDGISIVPVTKTLVYQGSHANLEGLCLGQSLDNEGRAMIGVVDNGDPFSENTIVVFRIQGLGSPAECLGDIADDFGSISPQGGPDGVVGFGDFLALLGLVGACPGGVPGCIGDFADDFGTLPPLGGPDGQVGFGDFLALLGLVGPCP